MSYYYGLRRINDWPKDKDRIPLKGISLKNALYESDLAKVGKSLARTAVINYFLFKRLGIKDCITMAQSARKQKDFCGVVCRDLEKYSVDPKWDKSFERDIKSIERRCEYIYTITKENLKMTQYWPFFEAVGLKRLLDFESGTMANDGETLLDNLLPEIDEWMSLHKSEVDEYMESIKPEIERKERFLARKDAAIRKEMADEKAKKKAEKEEIKMLKEQAEANRKADAKWNKEYNSLVERAHQINSLYSSI
jgi:hypothetical protein